LLAAGACVALTAAVARKPLPAHPRRLSACAHNGPKPADIQEVTTVPSLKQKLLKRLEPIDGLTAEPSMVAGGTALFCRGKELAHFHHDNELDLRLTRKLIKSLGISHPSGSVHHPARAASSQWIELRFHTVEEVDHVAELVRLAIAQL
jgi:hypothetical protein